MFSFTITLLITAAVSFALGWLTKMWLGQDNKKEIKLAEELEATKNELHNYQLEINNYFGNTANLFNNLSLQYKNLYDHLADGAKKLCKNEPSAATPLLQHEATNPNWQKLVLGQNQEPDHNWHPTYFEARDAKDHGSDKQELLHDINNLQAETMPSKETKHTNQHNKNKEEHAKVVANAYETSNIE